MKPKFKKSGFLFVSVLFLFTVTITGCKVMQTFKSHTAFDIVQTPTDLNDTIAVTASIWGVQDMVSAHVPANSGFGKFWVEATKNCQISIEKSPKDWNDTTTLKVLCHSQGKKIASWFPKK